MKKNYVYVLLFLCFSVLAFGCTNKDVTNEQSNEDEVKIEIPELSLEDALEFMKKATAVDVSYYYEPRTTEESYTHFQQYFTKNYVDKIILGTGNLKLDGDKWIIAYEGGELVEGSFMNSLFTEPSQLQVTEDETVLKLVNKIGDGLYAPHTETITFVYTNNGWKIDDLVWE